MMLGITFPAVFGRTFTDLMVKLTAVVEQLLFLYISLRSTIVITFMHSGDPEFLRFQYTHFLLKLLSWLCRFANKSFTFFHVSVTSFKLPIVVGTSIFQAIIRYQRISLNKSF